MKKYDFEKAMKLIEQNKEDIVEASLGMHEDWFWTADTIFKDGEYTRILDQYTEIGGIQGSSWATPTLNLEFKNGEDKMIPCYKGESNGSNPLAGIGLGVLSSEVQTNITPLDEE